MLPVASTASAAANAAKRNARDARLAGDASGSGAKGSGGGVAAAAGDGGSGARHQARTAREAASKGRRGQGGPAARGEGQDMSAPVSGGDGAHVGDVDVRGAVAGEARGHASVGQASGANVQTVLGTLPMDQRVVRRMFPEATVAPTSRLGAFDAVDVSQCITEHRALLGLVTDGTSTALEARQLLRTPPLLLGQDLARILSDASGASTCGYTKRLQNAWRIWLEFRACHAVPVDAAEWPPANGNQWTTFLAWLRTRCKSYTSFCNTWSVLLTYASRAYPMAPRPTVVHKADHGRALRLLLRQYGVGMNQVQGITMEEARNFHKFIDPNSCIGLLHGTAFAVGCVTGRRGRTVTAIRLEDVEVFVVACNAKGRDGVVRAPCVKLRFVDEKFMDVQGHRKSSELIEDMQEYSAWAKLTYSYWVYRLLAVRGAFKRGWDPLCDPDVPLGGVLEVRDGCKDWFLLCDAAGDRVVDTLPITVDTLSNWNRAVLLAMDAKGRGYSAHRRGAVTRALILELLKNKGSMLSPGVENVLLRFGGWDCTRGLDTVRRTYQEKVIDEFLDRLGLAYGREGSDEEWEARKARFMGADLTPSAQPSTAGCGDPPVLRWMAGQDTVYQLFKEDLCRSVMQVMAVARHDPAIMQNHRYMAERQAFNLARQSHAADVSVQRCERLWREQTKQWREALQRCRVLLMRQFEAACTAAGKHFVRCTVKTALKHVLMRDVGTDALSSDCRRQEFQFDVSDL